MLWFSDLPIASLIPAEYLSHLHQVFDWLNEWCCSQNSKECRGCK